MARSSSLRNGGSFRSTGRSVDRPKAASSVPMCARVVTPRRVRAAGVQLEPVDVGSQELDRLHRLAELLVRDARESRRRPSSTGQVRGRGLGPRIGQPHRVDDRPAPRRTGDPGLGVPRSRRPRDGPAHDEAESQPPERVEVPARLVEARGETDRVREADPAEVDLEGGIANHAADALPRQRQSQQGVATRCDASGGRAKNAGRPTAPYQPPSRRSRRPTPVCYPPDPWETTSCGGWWPRRSCTGTSCSRAASTPRSTSTSSASSPTPSCSATWRRRRRRCSPPGSRRSARRKGRRCCSSPPCRSRPACP